MSDEPIGENLSPGLLPKEKDLPAILLKEEGLISSDAERLSVLSANTITFEYRILDLEHEIKSYIKKMSFIQRKIDLASNEIKQLRKNQQDTYKTITAIVQRMAPQMASGNS